MADAFSFPTGPTIGAQFPDFTLPDQSGTLVTYETARAGKRAMIVLYRSASW